MKCPNTSNPIGFQNGGLFVKMPSEAFKKSIDNNTMSLELMFSFLQNTKLIHRNFRGIVGNHSFIPKGFIGFFLKDLDPLKFLCFSSIPKWARSHFFCFLCVGSRQTCFIAIDPRLLSSLQVEHLRRSIPYN